MARLITCRKCGKIHRADQPCTKPLTLTLKEVAKLKRENTNSMEYYDRLRSKQVWKKKRDYIYKRDKCKCAICNSIDNLEVHHIIAMKKCLEKWLDNDNLITLCKSCHIKAELGLIPIRVLKNKIPPTD